MGGSRRRWQGRRFTDAERFLAYKRILEGRSYVEIASELNCSLKFLNRQFGTQKERARRDPVRLRKELAACLRTGRAARRRQGRIVTQGKIRGMVMISERPAEVEDRAVPGHWEGDLVIGKDGKSAVGTLVERKTRFLMLLHLPHGRTAAHVRDALAVRITELPDVLRRSLTWDQGKKLSQHAAFTVDTDGCSRLLLRSAQPLVARQQREHQRPATPVLPARHRLRCRRSGSTRRSRGYSLNRRPRETWDWRSPAEAYAETVAMTD